MLRQTDLIIWDEAVMAHKWQINAVDRSLRDIRQTEKPFGGLTTVFCGDFRQILPVIQGGSRAQIVNASIKYAHCWPDVVDLKLAQNMRLE